LVNVFFRLIVWLLNDGVLNALVEGWDDILVRTVDTLMT